MMELFLAARRLVRQPHHGGSVEQLLRHGALVETSVAPFGIPPKAWAALGQLTAAAVDAAVAADENEVRGRAAELLDLLRPFVQ